MRTVKVRHLYGVGETSAPWENHSLDEFIFMHPFLGFALACFKVMRLFAFKGVEKIWPAGKGVGELGKCKFQHKQKISPRREQSYLFQP